MSTYDKFDYVHSSHVFLSVYSISFTFSKMESTKNVKEKKSW
jgi:hypothetical protein